MAIVVKRFGLIGNFGALWAATAVSNLGDGVFKLALPLYATQLTDSPSLIAGVAFAGRLPWLLLALPAGVYADRFDRRRLMMGANWVRVVALSGLMAGILVEIATLPMLYLAALVLGIAETLADTAGSAVLPSIVATHELERGNARLVGVTTVTNEFIGPPLGGALAGLSLAVAFGSSAVLYLLAVGALWLMVGSFRPMNTGRPQMVRDIMAGWRVVWGDGLLRTLLIIVGVMNLGWSAWMAVMVVYVVGPDGLTEFEYGVMLTSIGIGGLVGTMVAVPMVKRLGRKWAIGADIGGTFVMMLIPAFTRNGWAIGAAAVIGGIGGAMWSIVVSSIRQEVVPNGLLGRTGGVFRLFGYGALAVGAGLAGVIGEVVSVQAVFGVCAVMTAGLVGPFWRVIGKRVK